MVIELEAGVELAACPFCGSDAKLKSDGWFNPKLGKNENPYFWVKCQNASCGASHDAQSTQESAISKWNERA